MNNPQYKLHKQQLAAAEAEHARILCWIAQQLGCERKKVVAELEHNNFNWIKAYYEQHTSGNN